MAGNGTIGDIVKVLDAAYTVLDIAKIKYKIFFMFLFSLNCPVVGAVADEL